MKKFVILSVNDNPKYMFYIPLVTWAWHQLGWTPFVIVKEDFSNKQDHDYDFGDLALVDAPDDIDVPFATFYLNYIDGYKSETMAQVSRLYAASLIKSDAYLMLSDADMLPLSDYWSPKHDRLTVYGRDLTDYHYPMCYIGASGRIWHELMDIKSLESYGEICEHDKWTVSSDSWDDAKALVEEYMKRDMRQQPNIWLLDQDLITERINASNFVPERIDRGTDKRTGYPIGRVDRSNWTLNHSQFIDAHLPHDVLTNEHSFKKVLELLHTVWPKENWSWWINYYKEFKKMMK